MRLKVIPHLGGRSLCSSKQYSRGEVVVSKELPSISFNLNPPPSPLLAKIEKICETSIKCSELDKVAITACAVAYFVNKETDVDLSEYYVPSEYSSEVDLFAQRVMDGTANASESKLVTFILVNLYNSHHRAGRVHLYERISKMAHSCDPNVRLIYESDGDELSGIALRNIEPDEPLTFSYLSEGLDDESGLILGSVSDRRSKLRRTKGFACACARCLREEEEDGEKLLLPTHLKKSLSSYFTSFQAKEVDWDEIRTIVKARCPENLTPDERHAQTLLLALGLYDLVEIPQLYGLGIAICDGFLAEGSNCLARVASSRPSDGLILSGVLPALPELVRQFNRIPKNIKIKQEVLANLDLFVVKVMELLDTAIMSGALLRRQKTLLSTLKGLIDRRFK